MSYITAIGTANPFNKFSQSEIAEFMIKYMRLDEADARKLRVLYRVTGIEDRHSVIADYGANGDNKFFPSLPDGEFPSTKERMLLYEENAVALSVNAARNCLSSLADSHPDSFTHIIVVSCTGLQAPGLDIALVKELSLPTSIQRLCINFMGCYAAFNAIKVASSYCDADKNAKVLVVCTELCSIHFQSENTEDNLLANALFADGSAALVVEGRSRKGINLRPEKFFCDLAIEGEHQMAWAVGDHGFEMKLSSYVPEFIGNGIKKLTQSLLKGMETDLDDVSYFAIHPGGKRILEVIEKELGLTREQNKAAYDVLRRFGNMSSATVIFVLQEIIRCLNTADDGKKILSFAFGPGLTLESMLIKIEVIG